MLQLAALGTGQTKKTYINHGAREPLFGVSVANLKPIAKKIKKDHILATKLYQSGNYDAMYLAGMIADTKVMDEAEFELWMDGAYFYMISDYTMAILLAQSDLAFVLADKWIQSSEELRMSAGWSGYSWMLGNRKDETFDYERIHALLKIVENTIHESPNRTRYAMNNFLISVGVSYMPLHDEAVRIAEIVGKVIVEMNKTSCKVPLAKEYIAKTKAQGRLGFKRKSLRC